jgi:hypothetical protein
MAVQIETFQPEKRTLGQILSSTSPPIRVPEYQRDYSWETQQVTEFCKHGARIPETNAGYWVQKIDRNVARDLENQEEWKRLGWDALILWECQDERGCDTTIQRIANRCENSEKSATLEPIS